MHVDMDAFFASVEQRDRPELRGRPVVVGALPGRRGVVATCSYEARAFGIRSAMPISEAYRRCPDAVYLRPDMGRYAAASEKVMACLAAISPVVEPVSIDEAYVDISGLERLFGPPEAIGRRAKDLIRQRLHLNASIGIGPNRLIAKLASEFGKPDGLKVVMPDQVLDQVLDFISPMPVSNLRGVGRQTLKILQGMGITTVAQLRLCPLERLQQRLGEKGGLHLYRQARGIASDRVGDEAERRSISKETTFNEDQSDEELLRGTLLRLASEVGRIARREGVKGRVVTLKLRLQGFETHSRQRRLEQPTNSDRQIFQTGWALYRNSGYAGRPVRLIGIGVSDWGEEAVQRQADLFAPQAEEEGGRETQLYETMDRIVERFGKGKLGLGAPVKKQKGNSD